MKICGNNEFSQLNEESNDTNLSGNPCINPPRYSHLDISSLLSFSIFSEHSVIITKEKRAFAIGNNEGFRITSSLPDGVINHETEIIIHKNGQHLCQFLSSVCGSYYTLYLISGENGEHNQLAYTYSNINNGVPLFVDINGHNPQYLFGGEKTSAAIDSDGLIYIITQDVFTSPTKTVKPSPLPDNDRAIGVACCNTFIVALGASGRVFVASPEAATFQAASGLEGVDVVEVSGACEHCLAVSSDGRAFGLGSNSQGRLGVGGESFGADRFVEISSLKKLKIVSVSAGWNHSLFVASDGRVLACGSGYYGQLLHGGELANGIIFSPAETTISEGATFCIAGSCVSAVFVGTFPPPNTPNRTIRRHRIEVESEAFFAKDEVIARLRLENASLQQRAEQAEDEAALLRNEASSLRAEHEELASSVAKAKEEFRLSRGGLEKLKSVVNDLRQARSESSTLRSENSALRAENSTLQSENSTLQSENSTLQSENSTLRSENASLRADNASLREEVARLKSAAPKKHDSGLTILDASFIDSLERGEKIGRGATSEVRKVLKKEAYALKLLDVELCMKESDDDNNDEPQIDVDKMGRFLMEYEVISKLDHPNIVRAFGFFFGDATRPPAILLEFCPSSLRKQVKKLQDSERVSVIVELASAMRAVHAAGLIHRDLKLENVLLDGENHVRLCDFGFCALIDNDDASCRTQMAGTLCTMAPEVIRGRKDYDKQVDVYSFGVVVFMVLSGGKRPEIDLADVVSGKQAEIPDSITPFSKSLIQRCWAFEPSDRPTFDEICSILDENKDKII